MGPVCVSAGGCLWRCMALHGCVALSLRVDDDDDDDRALRVRRTTKHSSKTHTSDLIDWSTVSHWGRLERLRLRYTWSLSDKNGSKTVSVGVYRAVSELWSHVQSFIVVLFCRRIIASSRPSRRRHVYICRQSCSVTVITLMQRRGLSFHLL